jgi:cytochrome P450
MAVVDDQFHHEMSIAKGGSVSDQWREVKDMKTGLDHILRGSQLFGPEMHEDPYPVYRTLREREPVHWDEALHAWVITSYDEVVWALTELSSDRVTGARGRFHDPTLQPLFDVLARLMVQRDDPDHQRIRNLIQKAFLRTSVDRWSDTIVRRIRSLLQVGLQSGQMDFMWDFAVPLPVLVISEIVGIPEDDQHRVKQWCDDFALVATNFYAHISADQLERGWHSTEAFRTYLNAQVDEVRRAPRDDLLTALVHVEEEGTRLTLDELLANVILLLNAGNETTTNLLGNGLVALLQHPDQLQRLRHDPTLIPNAVEELLRYDSPVQFLGRIATSEADCGGQRIRHGDLVLPVLGAANRDPAQFPDPDHLDVTRQASHHVAFGHGHHYCAGAPLARLEGRLAFSTLLTACQTLELATTDLQHHENFNLRGYSTLPIRLSS